MISFDLASFPNEDPPTLIPRRPAATERRGGPRLPIEIDVDVEGGAHRFRATTGDLSSGGIFIVTARMIPIGAHVLLAFTLPNGATLEVLGTVAHHADAGIGLAFFCLEPTVKDLLERFCAAREALYYTRHVVADS